MSRRLVLVLLAMAGAGAPAAPAAAVVPITRQACPAGVPARARCGLAAVRADATRPGAGRLRVWFARIPARTRPSRGVVIPLAGGPGGSVSSSLEEVGLVAGAVPDQDVLLVDARGTGRSGFLRCRALEGELAVGQGLVAANARCAAELGRRRDLYTTSATVADIEAIRRALHLGRPSLLGFSYGTFAATVYAVRHPRLVRAVVLDGAFPLRDDPFSRRIAVATVRVLRTICERTRRCDPDAAVAALGRLAANLRAAPAVLPGARQPLTEAVLATVLPGLLQAGDTGLVADVERAAGGDTGPLARRIAPQVAALPAGQRGFSAALGATVICNDYRFAYDVHGPVAGRAAALARGLARLGPDPFGLFSAAAWLQVGLDHPSACLDWPRPRTPRALRVPDRGPFPASVPVLVTNGDLDLQTPLSGAQAARAQFRRSVLVVVPNAPHVTLFSSSCAQVTIFGFLRTRELPRAAACARRPVALPAPGAGS